MATIKVTLEELDQRLGNLINQCQDPRAVLDDIGFQMVQTTINRFSKSVAPDGTPWKPITRLTQRARSRQKSDKPLQDTGLLKASISHEVIGDTLHVGTPEKKAGIHQTGGTITPKRAKMLAIPATPEARMSKPRDIPGLFLVKHSGKMFLTGTTNRGALRIFYILKKSVTIPARPFIGYTNEDHEFAVKIIFDHLDKNA